MDLRFQSRPVGRSSGKSFDRRGCCKSSGTGCCSWIGRNHLVGWQWSEKEEISQMLYEAINIIIIAWLFPPHWEEHWLLQLHEGQDCWQELWHCWHWFCCCCWTTMICGWDDPHWEEHWLLQLHEGQDCWQLDWHWMQEFCCCGMVTRRPHCCWQLYPQLNWQPLLDPQKFLHCCMQEGMHCDEPPPLQHEFELELQHWRLTREKTSFVSF